MKAKMAFVLASVTSASALDAADETIQTRQFICTGVRHDYNADGAHIGGVSITQPLTISIAIHNTGNGLAKGPIDGSIEGEYFDPRALFGRPRTAPMRRRTATLFSVNQLTRGIGGTRGCPSRAQSTQTVAVKTQALARCAVPVR
jgi:hypothetical protein